MTSNGTYPKWQNKDKLVFGSKGETANIEYKYIINNEAVSNTNILSNVNRMRLPGKMEITEKLIYPNFLRAVRWW